MATDSDSASTSVMKTTKTASVGRVVNDFTSLLDDVDSETIAQEYRVGLHSDRIDFKNTQNRRSVRDSCSEDAQ